MYNNLDLNALNIDDIVEEYKLLHERHQQLKERSEEDAQRIHELKRSLDTALAAEQYLTQELEHLSVQPAAICAGSELRLQQELEELRRKYRELQSEHESLQVDNEVKDEETRKLQTKLESAVRDLDAQSALKANAAHDECAARLNTLEAENAELMQKLAEYEDARVQNTFVVAEQERTIEILKDQVSCLEENLRCKRDELEEKLQLLESSQEQLVDANAKIALLSSAPEQNERKGNSLFAEVDDQRQVMKHLLASQKKSYLDMKKIFNESKFEIHRLKRENIAMHTELQACSTIFCSADKTYQNKLNERIRQLMLQNAKLERNLNLSQERLRELASQKSVTWLDSMLDFCKRETDELKTQLHSMYIQKATLEEQMRNVQQDMARWRFESLKSRCVLIDRENLLTEHKISFKPMTAMEFDIKESQLQAALPRIVSVTANSGTATPPPGVIVLDTPMKAPAANVIVLDTPLKVEQCVELPPAEVEIKQELPQMEEQQPVTCKMELEQMHTSAEEAAVKPVPKGTPVKPRLGLIQVKAAEQLMSPKHEPPEEEQLPAAANRKETPVKLEQFRAEINDDDEPVLVPVKPMKKGTPVKPKQEPIDSPIVEFKPLRRGTPIKPNSASEVEQQPGAGQVRSILAKKRDLFAEDSHKNVQFSSSSPIVHNLSPDVPSPPTCSKENERPMPEDVKPPKKSQNIIRRIVVAPKKTGFTLK
ncbi:hypothetical protein KR222_002908 [Zaprionus bogoriensis]|nr:hypothetical protein KR222_002908 [Zaprionus bogoriensis]